MSDWIRLAFVSRYEGASPVVALNDFNEVLDELLCDAIPRMPQGQPASALAAFVADCVQAVRDPRCVELRNLDVACQEACEHQTWPSDHPIWNHVDLLVDVDRWFIHEQVGERPLPGADTKPRFDPERFERWPRRIAWLASLFARDR